MLIRNIISGAESERRNLYVNHFGISELISDEKAGQLPPQVRVLDAGDDYLLLPGLLDSHVHGYGGHDFSDGTIEAVASIARQQGENGVAYCAATLVSLELNRLKSTLAVLDEYVVKQNEGMFPGSAKIVAVHLEGPFISHSCKGAHDAHALQPKISLDMFKAIISAAPNIREWKITVAPDIEDAIEFIRGAQHLVIDGQKVNVKVFIGHTNAEPALVNAAIAAGAVGFTHLGNANDEKVHRSSAPVTLNDIKSNVVKSAVTTGSSTVELIVDGLHLSESFVAFIASQLWHKVMLITDALSPAGKPDGKYKLGSLDVIKTGDKIVLASEPDRLAGSVATLPKVLKNYHKILRGMQKSYADIAQAIYYAVVINPRMSTLSEQAIQSLPDNRNFLLMDNRTGEIVFHVCDGVIKHLKTLPGAKVLASEGRMFYPNSGQEQEQIHVNVAGRKQLNV